MQRLPDGPTAITVPCAGSATTRLGLIVALLVATASPASATPATPPRCEVDDPKAVVAEMLATPLVKALEARKWKVAFADPRCQARYVGVILRLTPPPDEGWPMGSQLVAWLSLNTAAPWPDKAWHDYGKVLLASLDRLWTVPIVKRFRSIVSVEHVDVHYSAGPEMPMGVSSPDSIRVTLLSMALKDEKFIEDASGLRIEVAPTYEVIETFWIRAPALAATVDKIIPGFGKVCPIHPGAKAITYESGTRTATMARDPRDLTRGTKRECSLPEPARTSRSRGRGAAKH